MTKRTAFSYHLRDHRKRSLLSQLALAERAGLSQKHVSFLETGRSQPGRDVVLRLSKALEMNPIATDVFLAAAGFAPPQTSHDDRRPLTAALTAVRRIMQQQDPYPAVLVDTAQQIIETNTGFDRLMRQAARDDLFELTCPDQPNLLRVFLHEKGLFDRIINPGELVPSLLRRVVREARGDPEAHNLVDEILAWPHIRRLVPDLRPSENDPEVFEERYMISGAELSLICLITSIGAPGSAEAERLRLEMFHPADKATDALINSAYAREE